MIQPPAFYFGCFDVLEHAKHDRADKGDSDVGRHNAQLVDERTQGHHKPPEGKDAIGFTNSPSGLERTTGPLWWSAITRKANDPFQAKKVSVAVHLFHLGDAQTPVTWLKSRENKALMSP